METQIIKDWNGNSKAIFATHGASNHSKEDRAKLDYYSTDPYAVEKLLEVEEFKDMIWEPCCGGGHISELLWDKGYDVWSTDIVHRGYAGQSEDDVYDFLKLEPDSMNMADIITNPPYALAKSFVEKALDISEDGVKVAMLLKLTFLEGVKRKELFEKYPPKRIHVFRSRIDCWKNGEKPEKASKAVCYAWFVWEKGFKGEPVIRWID